MMICTAILAMTLLPPPDADPAEHAPISIALLPVETSTDVAKNRIAVVHAAAQAQLSPDELSIAPQAEVESAGLELAASCGAEAGCRGALAKRVGVDFLLLLTVEEPSPQDFELAVRVLDDSGTEIVGLAEACLICSDADLKRLARERTLDALARLRRHVHREDLEDAAAADPVGVPESIVRTRVEIRSAKTSPLIPSGAALIGAGAATTIGGAVLLALTGQSAGCPADTRAPGCVDLDYDNVVPGAIVAGAGVAVVVTGIGLLVAGKKRTLENRRERSTAVRVGPGSLVLQGRF